MNETLNRPLDADWLERRRGYAAYARKMPRKRIEFPYIRHFSAEEMPALAHGLLPENGWDDRWFTLMSEGHVDLHRTWTGILIFRIPLIPEGDGARAERALANGDPRSFGDFGATTEERTRYINDILNWAITGYPR